MQIARIVLLLAALSAVRTLCGQFRAPPELLFSASFDKDISADFAKGSPLASESHGAALVPGYCGNAVRLCAEARSSLSYRAEGNVDSLQRPSGGFLIAKAASISGMPSFHLAGWSLQKCGGELRLVKPGLSIIVR